MSVVAAELPVFVAAFAVAELAVVAELVACAAAFAVCAVVGLVVVGLAAAVGLGAVFVSLLVFSVVSVAVFRSAVVVVGRWRVCSFPPATPK